MKKLNIGILDLVTAGPASSAYAHLMNANLASIMPQALAVWCEEAGHQVHFICYTGFEDLNKAFPDDIDILFIGAFTRSALLAYALSNLFRKKGVVTVLGGPHARCYPEDARQYFDYVLGFTDRALIDDVLGDCSQHRPQGLRLAAKQQPAELPSVEQRWKYISATLAKSTRLIKIVPMIGSLGCPYSCAFCIDSTVKYQTLDYDQIRDDLRFVRHHMPGALVGWHDPNFGIRFDDYMSVIEEAVPKGSVRFIAETSLALLSESNVKRMGEAGCVALLPGIESWYSMGNKSHTGRRVSDDKVAHVAEHINMILRHVPYVQTNFVLGLDDGAGSEPFELTKKFLDLAPGAFPAYSLLTAFGEAAPMNLDLQRDGRVIGFPFAFLDNNKSMNVRPQNYEWLEFYDHLIDLMEHSFSWKAIGRRFMATNYTLARIMNFTRAISGEGFGRIKYHRHIRDRLASDRMVRDYHELQSSTLPAFYHEKIEHQLGKFWEFLPKEAISHDPNAYLASVQA